MTSFDFIQQTDGKLILRDYLAADRTLLASERTLLAYLRTALTFFVAAISIIKFFNSLVATTIGIILLIPSILILLFGFKRYYRVHHNIHQLNNHDRSQLQS